MQELKYKWIESYKYELAEVFTIKLKWNPGGAIRSKWITFLPDGTLIIEKYFKWNGASGPTIDQQVNFRGALVHDALYRLLRLNLLSRDDFRKLTDKTLHDICEFDGMNDIRTDAWYTAVRLFAKSSSEPDTDSDRQDKVITYTYEDYNI